VWTLVGSGLNIGGRMPRFWSNITDLRHDGAGMVPQPTILSYRRSDNHIGQTDYEKFQKTSFGSNTEDGIHTYDTWRRSINKSGEQRIISWLFKHLGK
jgi:hypothetical protein